MQHCGAGAEGNWEKADAESFTSFLCFPKTGHIFKQTRQKVFYLLSPLPGKQMVIHWRKLQTVIMIPQKSTLTNFINRLSFIYISTIAVLKD
jgi:hypothetical protein